MQNNKNVQIAFIASFLFLVSAVSISQGVLELLRGDQPSVIQLFLKQPSQKNLRLYEKTLESNNWISEYIQPIMRKWQFLFLHDSGKEVVMGIDDWFFFLLQLRKILRIVLLACGVKLLSLQSLRKKGS